MAFHCRVTDLYVKDVEGYCFHDVIKSLQRSDHAHTRTHAHTNTHTQPSLLWVTLTDVFLLTLPLMSVCFLLGDGGNDVSMIQEADCGVGVEGKVRTSLSLSPCCFAFTHTLSLLSVSCVSWELAPLWPEHLLTYICHYVIMHRLIIFDCVKTCHGCKGN